MNESVKFCWYLAQAEETIMRWVNFVTVCQLVFARGRYKDE